MKKHKYILLIIIILISLPVLAAEYGIRDEDKLGQQYLFIRSNPTVNSSKVRILTYGDPAFEILEKNYNGEGCSDQWYKIKYYSASAKAFFEGYVCSTFIKPSTLDKTAFPNQTEAGNETSTEKEITAPPLTETEFIEYLNKEGFPTSYQNQLISLHRKYPKWIFKAYKTKDNWYTTMKAETYHGRSLHPVGNNDTNGWCKSDNSVSFYYNWYADKYVRFPKGSGWCQAADQSVAYYLDPRNSLNERHIFQFEKLDFISGFNYDPIVKSITNYPNTYVSKFTNEIIEAGRINNLSPAYIASLIIQETGYTMKIQTNGTHVFTNHLGQRVSGYYNFLNIGAYDIGNPAENGLVRAYKEGWDTPAKAIINGAAFISNSYINIGQNTKYLTKFNVTPISHNKGIGYYHQYMTDIRSPKITSNTTFNSYLNSNLLQNQFIFEIPVFDNMPAESPSPNPKNPNNYLSELKINGQMVAGFDGAVTNYTFDADALNEINITANKVHPLANISNTGIKKLTKEKEVFTIEVTAYNGDIRNYNITVNKKIETPKPDPTPKPEKPVPEEENKTYIIDGSYIYNLGLNYKKEDFIKSEPYAVIEKDILTTGTNIKIGENIYQAIIFGDINGDNEINILDLLILKKHILKYLTLEGAESFAADVNRDGVINILDLLILKKHILKYLTIKQY